MYRKPLQENKNKIHKEIPFVVWLWTMALGFVSYVVTRIALDGYPHPVHWAVGAGGVGFGYLFGWLWFRWKGDVV